jgi:hypothetical protein
MPHPVDMPSRIAPGKIRLRVIATTAKQNDMVEGEIVL